MTETPTPGTYRKTAPVKALQWDGTAEGATPIIDWIIENGGNATYECSDPVRCSKYDGDCPHYIVIQTLEGRMPLELNGWACQGVAGEFWPIKGEIFANSYEEVSE